MKRCSPGGETVDIKLPGVIISKGDYRHCKTITFSKKTLREDRWIEISNLIKIIPPTGVFLSFRRAEV